MFSVFRGSNSGSESFDSSSDTHVKSDTLRKINSKGQSKERYVEITEESQFHYYYKNSDTMPQGTVDLTRANFVRPYDESPNCIIFELQDGATEKVIIFECANHEEMISWVETLDHTLRKAKLLRKLASDEPQITTERMAAFESGGIEAFVSLLATEIEPLMSALAAASKKKSKKKDKAPPDPLRTALDGATELTSYYDDVVQEIQVYSNPSKVNLRAKAVLVLCATVEVNRGILSLLSPLLPPSPTAPPAPSLGDLHALITWLTQYQTRLKAASNIFPPCQSPLRQQELQKQLNSLFSCLPQLCEQYVYGSCGESSGSVSMSAATPSSSRTNATVSTGSTSAATNLLEYCLRIWSTVAANPTESLQRHAEGQPFTQAPTDIWRILHQHLSLARISGSVLLHFLVTERVAAALEVLTIKMMDSISGLLCASSPPSSPASPRTCASTAAHNPYAPAEWSVHDFDFLSAVANDIALHTENVLQIVTAFNENEDLRARLDKCFQPVVTALVQCGQLCLSKLVTGVLSDTHQEFETIWSLEWLSGGKQVEIICSTINDYLSDLKSNLTSVWHDQLLRTLFDQVAARYAWHLLMKGGPEWLNERKRSVSSGGLSFKVLGMGFGLGVGSDSPLEKSGKPNPAVTTTIAGSTDPISLLVHVRSVITHDLNAMHTTFSVHLDASSARASTDVVAECVKVLFLPFKELQSLVSARIREYGSHPGEALIKVAVAAIGIREISDGILFTPGHPDSKDETAEGSSASTSTAALGTITASTSTSDQTFASIRAAFNAAINASKPADASAPPSRLESRFVELAFPGSSSASIPANGHSPVSKQQQQQQSYSPSILGVIGVGGLRITAPSAGSDATSYSKQNSQDANFVQDILESLYEPSSAPHSPLSTLSTDTVSEVSTYSSSRLAAISIASEAEYQSGQDDGPVSGAWQRRYCRVMTRKNDAYVPPAIPCTSQSTAIPEFIHTFLAYKKQAGTLLFSLDLSTVTEITIIECSRPLRYVLDDEGYVCVSSGVGRGLANVRVSRCGEEAEGIDKVGEFVLMLTIDAAGPASTDSISSSPHAKTSPTHYLRLSTADQLTSWVNALSMIASLVYNHADQEAPLWIRLPPVERKKALEAMRQEWALRQREESAASLIKMTKAAAAKPKRAASTSKLIPTATHVSPPIAPSQRPGVITFDNPLIAMKAKWEKEEQDRLDRVRLATTTSKASPAPPKMASPPPPPSSPLSASSSPSSSSKKNLSVRFTADTKPQSPSSAPPPPPPPAEKSWFSFRT